MTKPKDGKPQNPSDVLPKPKDASSSANYHLTPSEIESLRENKREIGERLKGRFVHLRPKAK